MKRSEFLGSTAFGLLSVAACDKSSALQNKDKENGGDDKVIKTIGGKSFKQLQTRYHKELLGELIPNLDRYVIDHKYGGFMCDTNIRTGKQVTTHKTAWFEGRGMWVYSFLYNNIKQDPHFLEVARKSKDFIMPHQPKNGGFWPGSYSREGKPLSGPGDIYGNLFIAQGLQEYAKAAGEEHYFDHAKKIVLSALARYDSPDYQFDISYGPPDAPKIKAPRVLGHWMVFLGIATQMLEQESDPKLEKLANRCLDAIMNHHLNPNYNLFNEGLNHDFSLPGKVWAQFSYTGHSTETLWGLMYEAARRKDNKLYHQAKDLFKRYVRLTYDGVYGGHYRSLINIPKNKWVLDKVEWLQEEVLIGSLFVVAHTGEWWDRKFFADTDDYVERKFHLPGLLFWPTGANRKVSDYNNHRAGNYHHPRRLMLNLVVLDHLIKRNGKISGLFT